MGLNTQLHYNIQKFECKSKYIKSIFTILLLAACCDNLLLRSKDDEFPELVPFDFKFQPKSDSSLESHISVCLSVLTNVYFHAIK